MKFLDLVQTMQMAIKALGMYTEAHPRAQEALQALSEGVAEWLKEKPALHMAASSGKLFLDGAPVEAQNLHTAALARQLAERQIAGFIIHRGVRTEDLLGMLKILMLKPSMLESMGGAAKVIADQRLSHITLGQIQYKEVREGDAAAAEAEGAPALTAGAPQVPPLQQDVSRMLEKWQEGLQTYLPASPAHLSNEDDPDLLTVLPADLAFLGPLAEGMAWGPSFPSGPQMESFRQAFHGLAARPLWSVMTGLPTLPAAPGGLELAFQSVAPELILRSVALMRGESATWRQLRTPLLGLLKTSAQAKSILAHLEANLAAGGLESEQLRELAQQIDWEQQNLEEKTRRALAEEDTFWELSSDQRLALLRSLLDLERFDAFLKLLQKYLKHLSGENVHRREDAARDLVAVSAWLRNPGLPGELQGPLVEGLVAHFGWEPILAIHRHTTRSLEQVLVCLVFHHELQQVQTLMHELEGLCTLLDDKHEWRGLARAKLLGRLSGEDTMTEVVEHLYRLEADKVLTEAIPYFEFLGEPAARYLVRMLAEEPDRRHRGRLLDVIRVLGPVAIPALTEGLWSPTWYVVRNTLNLLADMGDAGLMKHVTTALTHADGRVRASAVRATWKLGGPAACAPLLAALPAADPDTQLEILFGLGHTQSPAAVPGIAELAHHGSASLKVRIKAAEALGQIASAEALPILADLIKRKGRIFTSAEPTELRLAAARALLGLQTPQALATLKQMVSDEPRNQDREALQRLLDLHGPRA